MLLKFDHTYFMRKAYLEAEIAFEEAEIPVGAIIVHNNNIIAKAHNQTEKLKDPTAHAEILAITAACNYIGAKYLKDCTLYVTLEPCVMCAGAIFWAQINDIVIGANDEKRGFRNHTNEIFSKKVNITTGIMENDCAILLKTFFQNKRN